MYARIDTCNLKTRKEISLSSTWHMAYWKILNKITLKTSNNLTAVKKKWGKRDQETGGNTLPRKKEEERNKGESEKERKH